MSPTAPAYKLYLHRSFELDKFSDSFLPVLLYYLYRKQISISLGACALRSTL